jgi:hypothetical protein
VAGGGYIKLHRGWRDTDGLTPSAVFSDCEAWLWLLENCAWKELSRWNAKGEEIRLQPGQIHVSLRSLSSAWGWSKSKVERFLSRLERVGKAGRSTGQSGIILTIEKWAEYQTDGTATETAPKTDAGQPRDTQEEGKEGKEGKNYAFAGRVVRLTFSDFRRWQNAYPDIDLRAQLTARDDWLTGQPTGDQKRWFQSTSSWLAKRQQEASTSKTAEVEYPIC